MPGLYLRCDALVGRAWLGSLQGACTGTGGSSAPFPAPPEGSPTLRLPHCSGNFTGCVLALCLSIPSACSSSLKQRQGRCPDREKCCLCSIDPCKFWFWKQLAISVCSDLEEAGHFCLPGWSCAGAASLLPLAPGALQSHTCTEHLLKKALSLQNGLSLTNCLGGPLCSPQGEQTPCLGAEVNGEFIWNIKQHTQIANCLGSSSSALGCLAVCRQIAPRLFAMLLLCLSHG